MKLSLANITFTMLAIQILSSSPAIVQAANLRGLQANGATVTIGARPATPSVVRMGSADDNDGSPDGMDSNSPDTGIMNIPVDLPSADGDGGIISSASAAGVPAGPPGTIAKYNPEDNEFFFVDRTGGGDRV